MNKFIKREISAGHKEVVKKFLDLAAKEGLGSLCNIDVQTTIKNKTGKDLEKYIIIGICHPKSAYLVLKDQPDIGSLLPCSVAIYQKEEKTIITAMNPTILYQIIADAKLMGQAKKIEEKIRKIISSL